VSRFLELDAELEVLGSGHRAGLVEDEVDALWTPVRASSDSLALHVPSSISLVVAHVDNPCAFV
jgi:hypothetical protein